MAFVDITDDDLESVRDRSGYIERISTRAQAFMRGVVVTAQDERIERSSSAIFSYEDDGLITVKTPYGTARITFDLRVSARQIEGVHLVEKQIRNTDGELVWRTVWEIRTTQDGLYLGSAEKPSMVNGINDDILFWKAVFSIVYSIATAPIRCDK